MFAEAQARIEARKEAAKRAGASYATIAEVIPSEPPEAVTVCDPAVFERELGPQVLRESLRYVRVERLEGAEPREDASGWGWMDHRDTRRMASLAEGEWSAFREWKDHHRYLVVFVAGERELPGAVEGRRLRGALGSGEFDVGLWSGGLYIVDLQDREVLCGAPFSATNSEVVEFKDRGRLDRAFRDDEENQAPLRDLKKNVEQEANEALDKIAPRFKISMTGIFGG
ncbi:MAG: hypothetical protein EA397_02325 [Deltaproteobacteria bacterium]|nr:MAG: hypothetical protein EA397_02325 [Deltaproteobacteria bacterium]